PTVQDILQVIRNATGVALSVENVDTETPLFGSVTWSNTTAWSAMRNIAESPRVQGSWEKVGDGYRLRGTQPILAPQAPQPIAGQPNNLPPEKDAVVPRPRTALFLVGALFLAMMVV